ncbi:MAG: proteasome activator [Microthrixaceae bacterium]
MVSEPGPTDPTRPPTGGDEPPAGQPASEVLSPDSVSVLDGATEAAAMVGAADAQAEAPEVESPAKIIRIGAMVKQLLEELRDTELDEPSRDQLRDIYENSVAELKTAISPELAAELDQLSFAFNDEELPTGVELRLAKAQLVGWLEGLFHGMQAALMAQQMNMRQQLEGMRQQLPEHAGGAQRGGPGYL